MLANPHAALEREIARLTADLHDARAALIAADEARRVAERERDELTAVAGAAVDAWSAYQEPLPFTFEAAMSNLDVCLGDQDRARCWPPAPPAEPVFTWIVSPREAALFGEARPAVARSCWERSGEDA